MNRTLPVLLAALITGPSLLVAQDAHNLSRIVLTEDPQVSVAADPALNASPRVTFSVFPYSSVASDAELTGLLEKQALYALRNAMEARGYLFVPFGQPADLLVTLRVKSQYREKYVPPRTVLDFDYRPGHSFRVRTSDGRSAWGTVDGDFGLREVTRPGYVTGYYYPSVAMFVHDGRSLEIVWQGMGAGATKQPDARLGMQVVLRYVASRFPACVYAHSGTPSQVGRIGAGLWIFSSDGAEYLPTVLNVVDGSSAEDSGVKPYDMITAIDGQETANRPFGEILSLLTGPPESSVTLELKRGDKTLGRKVKRDQILSPPTRPAPPPIATSAAPATTPNGAPAASAATAPPGDASAVPPKQVNPPEPGMTLQQVQEALGPPDWQTSYKEFTRWTYKRFAVVFEHGLVTQIVAQSEDAAK